MKRLFSFLGYTWAAIALPMVLATFVGNNFWAAKLASSTGVTISPWFSGGEVARTIDHGTYQTQIHRPVFEGLFREKKKGFVQVDFVVSSPDSGTLSAATASTDSSASGGSVQEKARAAALADGKLPDSIQEDIDFNNDGQADFRVMFSTQKCTATTTALSSRAIGLGEVFKLDTGVGLRENVKNLHG